MSCLHLMYIGRLGTRSLQRCGTRFNIVRLVTTNITWRITNSRHFPSRIVSERSYLTSNQTNHAERHKRDNIPEDYVLIYTNNLEKNFKYSVLAVPGAIIIYCYLFMLYMENISEERDAKKHHHTFNDESVTDKIDEYLYSIFGKFDKREKINKEEVYEDMDINFTVAAFIFHSLLLIGLSFIYRQSVFRIYKHIDYQKFIGVLPRMFIFRKQFSFDIEDVQRKKIISSAAWCTGNVKIKNRTFLLISNDFKLPAYYNELFGYHRRH